MHYENVSNDCRSSINSLTEDTVSPIVLNSITFICTLRQALKNKFANVKRKTRYIKINNGLTNPNPNIKNVLDIESIKKPFYVEEVKCGLRKLKQNKASAIDSLTSEMMKCFN